MNRRRAAGIAAAIIAIPAAAAVYGTAATVMRARDAIRGALGKPPLRRRGMTS